MLFKELFNGWGSDLLLKLEREGDICTVQAFQRDSSQGCQTCSAQGASLSSILSHSLLYMKDMSDMWAVPPYESVVHGGNVNCFRRG